MKKEIILILTTILLLTNLAGCGTRSVESNKSNINEKTTSDSDKISEVKDINKSEQESQVASHSDSFGVTVDEVVEKYNKTLIKNNPNASQGDIDVCLLKDYSIQNMQSGDGRDITIYTYYFDGSNNYRGVNIIEDIHSHNVIYADLFAHNNLLTEEKMMRIFQEQYYYLTASVDDSIEFSKFNEIWIKMSQNNDFSTVYNNKKFFCMGKDEATYLGITLP